MAEDKCKYLFDRQNKRICLLSRYDNPTDEDCMQCQESGTNKVVGLGDRIATAINKTPIRRIKPKDCGCRERQDKLNRLMPVKDNKNGN